MFSTQDVMRIWGYSRNDTASKKIADLLGRRLVAKVRRWEYRKLATAL